MFTYKHVNNWDLIYRRRYIQEENETQCKYVYNITCTHSYILNGNSVLRMYIKKTSLLRRTIKNSPAAKDIKDKTSTDLPLKGSKRTVQRFSTKRHTNGLFRAIKPLKSYKNINIRTVNMFTKLLGDSRMFLD